jgi:superfamily I DNA/RNA helicase
MRVPDLSHVNDRRPAAAAPDAGGGLLLPPMSVQQEAIAEWVEEGSGSLFVEALAGTGKTTMLMQMLPRMRGTVRLVAFGKPIATELQLKIAALGLDGRCQASTFHSLGNGALRRRFSRAKMDAKKDWVMGDALSIRREQIGGVAKLVGLAKQQLIDPACEDLGPWLEQAWRHDITLELLGRERRDARAAAALAAGDLDAQLEDACALARRGLVWQNEHAEEIINFDDMIYLPVHLGLALEKFDWLGIDEAQDTNPARRELAAMMLREGSRSIWVGDRHQAIFGFTGADSDAVEQIISEFCCARLPLTVTYRCGKSIVARAQAWVPSYEAHSGNATGVVREIGVEALEREPLAAADAVLCRLTAPLVKLAFDLIRRRVPCHVEGRDIGAGLLKLIDRFAGNGGGLRELTRDLAAWQTREVMRLQAAKKDAQASTLEDKCDTLMVLMEHAKDVADLRATIASMFEDARNERRATLTLSTVHKAKGREWGKVYVLGANKWMPLPWVKSDWQLEQEHNLSYVAVTRAKSELVFVDVPMEDR